MWQQNVWIKTSEQNISHTECIVTHCIIIMADDPPPGGLAEQP